MIKATRGRRNLSCALSWLALSVAVPGCTERVVVGEPVNSDPDEESGDESDSEGTDSAGDGADCPECPPAELPGPEECFSSDYLTRAPYEEWLATQNDFASLAGTRWTGNFTSGDSPLTLTILEDQTAYLDVGTYVPPTGPGEGYLGIDHSSTYDQPVEGARYHIHGGTLEGDALLLPGGAPVDDWCHLQPPVWHMACMFGAVPYGPGELGDGCRVNGEEVDCSWLAVASMCSCTSEECFSGPPFSINLELVLQYDEEAGTLTGDSFHLGVITLRHVE